MKVTSKKENKWYFLSENSQWELCSTVSSGINDSLVGISDISEDIMSETGSDSVGISSHDDSESDTDSDYNPEPSTPAISPKRAELQLCFIQEIVNIKLIIII